MKGIDIVSFNPYWPSGVLVVSIGNSAEEIWEYIEECHVEADASCRKAWKKVHMRWKDVILSDHGRECISDINDPKNTTQGIVLHSDVEKDLDCFLLLLKPTFRSDNVESMITLAHECLHVCQFLLPMFMDRGEEKEAEAYWHSYLMRESLRVMGY